MAESHQEQKYQIDLMDTKKCASTYFWLGRTEYRYSFRDCKKHGGIMRFIQVSYLGASPSSPSRLLKAKAATKVAVLTEFPEVNSLDTLLLKTFTVRSSYTQS
ncbi:hypothetical protein CIPAW_05G147100 [Carya illinoinensis]|uniref:Uncharacterized protein n=1 Tax=Carya illinoinensis TaxID=32201 RepID=A0A8T1QJV6_CARIL|nr:hypothetical protein CIPAW_05G147100 [Carya illinoinensis]KAG6730893.1 hypothetical protein I3842_01G102300 [Carya illinoinensis]